MNARPLLRDTVQVALELTEDQALALAQFLKRIGYSDIRTLSVDGSEAHTMRAALYSVQRAVNHAGFDPR